LSLLDQNNETVTDPAPADAPATVGDAPAPAAATAPEGLPESFWKDGALDVASVKALYESTTEQQTKLSERAADIPEDGNYVIALPKDFVDDAGKPIEIDTENPAYQTLIEAAKELKLTTAEANKFAEMMVRKEVEQARAEVAAETKARNEELSKLGADPKVRIEAVIGQVKAHLGDDADALLKSINTAAGVVAVEKLLAKLNGPSPVPPLALAASQQKRVADIFYGSNKTH
jgi:hypothetical protein